MPAADSLHPVPDLDYDFQGFADSMQEVGNPLKFQHRGGLEDIAEVLREVTEHPHAVAYIAGTFGHLSRTRGSAHEQIEV